MDVDPPPETVPDPDATFVAVGVESQHDGDRPSVPAGHWMPEDEVPDLQRQVTALMWLKGLAQDQLEHGRCHGCRVNSAQALDELGLLDMMLAHIEVGDPRTLPKELQSLREGEIWPYKDRLGSR